MKIFVDDLQAALSAVHGEEVEIGTDREHPRADILIKDYLQQHFQLQVNEQPVTWTYLGREIEEQDFFAIWVYLRVGEVTDLRTLHVRHSILQHYLDTQENIVIVSKGGEIQRAGLRKGQAEKTFVF